MMDAREAAVERLYREVGPEIQSYLRRHLPDCGAADDLLQEVFVIVVRDCSALQAARSPRTWIFGIARNLLREHRRRARRQMSPLTDAQEATADTHSADGRIEAVKEAILGLPEKNREVLELRVGLNLTYEEIAEILAVPMGTVRSRLHYAVRALRDRLVAGHSRCDAAAFGEIGIGEEESAR